MFLPITRSYRRQIYDVGGARNQRQSWAPYFDDGRYSVPSPGPPFTRVSVNAIIFLAPISTFDQVLEEVCVHVYF